MDRKNVEDLYLLSPLQQGMLFETLYAPGVGTYVEQVVMVLGGRPRPAELRRAWQMVVDRHPALRTGFVWEGVPKPLQVVFRQVEVPFETHDWSGLGEDERETRWRELLRQDHDTGFDLRRAPLMRFALVRTGADEHRLLWSSHHILTDGWSLPIVLNDFAALYHGLLTGTMPRLRPVRPFREYIAWLNRQDPAAAEAFWRARLAGIPDPTPLPLDRAPSLAGDPPSGHAREHVHLSAETAAALEEAARRLRVTVSALLQGAWGVVLARMADVDEVVFGATVSGRPAEIPGVGEMVGMFINTIPVRVRLDEDRDVAEWIAGVHRDHAAAGEFEHAPLAQVQRWAGAHGDGGLFQTLLVYENYPLTGGEEGADESVDGGLEIRGMESTERTTFPFSVAVAPTWDGMRVSGTYDPRRLAAEDARRLLGGLAEVLRQIAGGGAARVAGLSPFSEDERRTAVDWSGRVPPPSTESIPALFEAAAAARPDAVAVRADDATLTYSELNAAANRLAHHLRALGVGMDDRVGVSMARSAELVVALLAILKAGAAYVPLDSSYPPERLRYMLRDSGVVLLLADSDAPEWADDARVVVPPRERACIGARPADDLHLPVHPDGLAYVVYTSGSTGTPKGVAVPHRAVVRLVRGADWVCLGPDETVLMMAPAAFDASTFEVWGALLNGGALAVHPADTPDPARLGAFLRERGVTTLWMTAGLFHQVADTDPSAFAGVRQLLTGGDVVSPAHVRRVMEVSPTVRVIDGYGPTENTTFTACHTVRAEDLDRGSIPIGRPVSGTQAYVVDGRMRPVPAGVPGELLAGGEGVARGYLGRPALTAEKFIPDPFSATPGARVYRTGDRVRWIEPSADSTTPEESHTPALTHSRTHALEFLGRIDQQLKVRGFRIEPGEVEAALKAHPRVADAVVDARGDGAGDRRLVAWIVPRDGAAPTASALRDALAGRLPPHLVPSAFVVLDALPLTPNGKVDRRALPAPEAAEGGEAQAAPRTPTEEVLAGLWAELLGVEGAGRDDDFFLLGGHSLIATQLASRVRQAFGVELPLRAVFEAPTLAAMAERVDGALRGANGVAVPPLERVGGSEFPLSFAQERLWFIDRLEPGSPVYNVPVAVRMRGVLDVAALERALGEVIARHDSLRTRFVSVDGAPVQRVDDPAPFALDVLHLATLSVNGEAEKALAEAWSAWAVAPFDLARGPLLRVRLLRLDADDHALLVSMHHIVSDGWSLGVFWRELAALYTAFVAGHPSPLPPPLLQFGDYALWQRGWMTDDAVRGQLEWWKERMDGAPARLELPTDRPRPAVESHRGATIPVHLPAELATGVRALARSEGATLFMALLSAWSAVLSRWSGQDEVVIGTPVAGRTRRETEELIGLFVNTLALRADLSGAPSFRALLRRAREVTLGAYAHQDLPFERLVEELHPERSLGHAPVFQVMLALNNTPAGAEDGLPGLALEGVADPGGVARVDLTLSLVHGPDGSLGGTLEYATDLFDAVTVERLIAHLRTLLAGAVRRPDAPVASLEMMTDAERAAVLAAAAAAAPHPAETTLHGWFARRARRTPDAPALTFGATTLTYAQLDARARTLARRLRARGAGAEVLVGLCVERSLETVIGILGILQSGAAYLPLDPAYPDDRLAYMLEDSGAHLVVASGVAADRLPSGIERIRLDEDEIQADSADLAPVDVPPDALAYVIYTSGSTGRPKGVRVTHANVVRLMTATEPWFRFGADDVWTLFHSHAFDFSVWEVWGALLYGGRVVVVPFDVSRDPARFHALLRDERVTVLNQTPSAFRQLIRADEEAGTPELALRHVIFGGEALDPSTLRGWVDRRGAGRPRLANMYGITETTVHVTFRVIGEADVRGGSSSPIGVPIPDLSVRLLDARGQLVPPGVAGEMYVGGGGVARGYLGRPALTAERFVPDPFAPAAGSRMYRSGDRARWVESTDALTHSRTHALEFLGRADEQVKVRGFRIEPGEIEAALRTHPAVRDAVVLARGEGDARRLVAWIVPSTEVAPAELRAHLLVGLPEYMVPAAFVFLDALPLTRNGKVDRRALPDPDTADLSAGAYVPPRTQTEQVVAALWGELLDAERVGAADGFFELGGHSLMATRVVSRLRDALGVEVPVRAVFEHPVLERFAAEVDRLLRASAGVEAPPIVPADRSGELPLSFAQERLWFIDRLEPGSPVYNMPFPLRLRGALDAAAMERALGEIVRRHEALRTRFAEVDGRPVQQIDPVGAFHLPTEEVAEGAMPRRVAEWSVEPFDLARGPLFRARLLRIAPDDHVLLVGMHHAVSDGWSVGVFFGELVALYRTYRNGAESQLPPLPVQYADYAVWQRGWLSGDALERQVAWWREHLAGAPALLELPTDRPRPALPTYRGDYVEFAIVPELAESVRALARREGATLFMAILSAWQVLLARWSGQDDVVIGTPVAGRTQRETEGLIGLFINTLPIRGDVSDDPAFARLLGRAREATLGAFAHQDLPFERLVEELHPARSLSHAPLYQVMFTLNNTPEGAREGLPDIEVDAVPEQGSVARLDLTLSMAERPDGSIAAALEYATDLFDRSTALRMARHLETLLAAAAASPESPVSTLPLLTAEERAALAAWNATDVEYETAPVHRWIERQAAATPDAVALTFEDAHVTYREMDRRASQLANRLRRLGVGPEVRVGLMLERAPEMVIAILAVLKAGGAYVPLDPGYPAERLAYMLADARVPVLLTQERFASLAADFDGPVLALDAETGALAAEAADAPAVDVPLDALAYVIYTSGSTGRPKGAMNAHRGVVNRILWMQDAFGLTPADAVLQKTPFSFDVSVWEFFWPLFVGARLVIAPPGAHRDPAAVTALIERERITTLHFVPSMLRAWLGAADATRCTSLRRVMSSGEALAADLVDGFIDALPSAELQNLYGPTEAAVDVTHWPCTRPCNGVVPIGAPIANTRIHVLDRRGAPCPVGVPGELYIAGVQVGRGYLDRPGLTAEKFVPDPFAPATGSRMYRTGDRARWREIPEWGIESATEENSRTDALPHVRTAVLEYLGRLDYQVKVRGFRIELGEIEAALGAHPAVREAVVVARNDGGSDARLVAYVVPAGAAPDPAALRDSLRARLPEHMVPAAWVVMDAIPLSPSGKADRRALPAPEAATAEFVAPRTPTEQALAETWAELLGVARVGAADGFFDLGGHSLLATRLVSAVRERWGVELPLRAVFEHPTLAPFAARVDRAVDEARGIEAPPLRPVPRGGDLPLSFAQERLWFVDRLEPGSAVYHMPSAYRLRGPLDVDAFRRALSEIVRRHETLRTALPFDGEQPVQRIAPSVEADLPTHDLRHLPDAERDAEAGRVMRDVAERAFDLARGPLWRAALVRMADDEHLLLVTLHHVISDGWSVGVLWTELSALYAAFAEGRPSPLSGLPVQYADFAAWQREWLSGDVLAAQLAYWRERLAGAPPLLELPTDHPRPAVQTYAGAEESFVLEGTDADTVRALAKREGSTLFMVLLAAMNVVFSRLAGQDDVVIGTPIAGRTRRETEGMIGLFLNSLALRTDLGGAPTFRALLRRVRETTLGAYAHQELPFERILEELAPERSLSHSPIFQVMLNLANFAAGEVSLPGVRVEAIGEGGAPASKFDLTLYAGEGPDSIALYLVYNTALFDAARAKEMLAQIVGVLRQAAKDADRPIAALSLLTDEARAVLPDPATALSDAWRGSVPDLFAAHAARTPDALAAEDPSERWTYADLRADTDAIARRLIADGVRPGEVVAILGHRSAALVRALIGTLRSGAAFLVLDPAYPPARLAEYVRIARPTGWIPLAAAGEVAPEVADALRETVVSTIPLDNRAGVADPADPGAPTIFPEIGPDSLAYLSFTSGTTGRPKAVMGRHGSLTHFTPWLAERFELGASDRFSLLSGLAHDPLHRDVFTPLQLGAAVVAPDPDEIGTPGYLAGWMRDARITVAHLTPAMGQLLTAAADEALPLSARDERGGGRGEGPRIDSLRRAFFVGDVLTRADVARMHALAPNLTVINYYGSTETQRAVAHFVVPRDLSGLAKETIPVGTGIPDVQVIIRNAAGGRAGVGEVGEMWMRSPHVALGYLGDPELTGSRFVDGAYRTGDLGRYRPDGVAEIAGRADQQVKIRGFRIEPGEIEAALRAHPAVRDAVVVPRGEGDGKRLVAYVVAEGEALSPGALREGLRTQVPDYMVPAAWVFLDALPLTPNGKVDRRALPEPETGSARASTPPRTPAEVALAEIWTALLDADRVDADDDFFALGGHSLLATRLVARVRDTFGIELPLRALFESPTLAALAANVDRLLRAEAVDAAPPILHRPHDGTVPASFAQERLWFVDRLEDGGAVYHIPTAQLLTGPVDPEAMRRAVEEVARRHETLRTALPEVDGMPVQRISPPGRVEVPFIDLSPLAEEERLAEAGRLAERSANDPFDMEAGPLFRASLVRLAENEHLLLVNLHHVIADGWSMRVLLDEVAALHAAFRLGEPSPLPPLPVQYADYAAWQREWLSGPVLQAQLGYWRSALAGAPPLLALPTDRPRPPVQGHNGASEVLQIGPDDAARIADLARREGATVFMVLLAALDVVLARWVGETDVVIGTPVAGRTRSELEGLIGLFLNSLALRTDLSGDPSFRVLLGRVRETTLGAYAHQDVPFERILEDLKPERSLGHTPVFQVMLNLLNYRESAGGEGEMTAAGPGAQLASKFDLTLYAGESEEGIGLHAVYDADLFDAARIRSLLAQVAIVLRQAADDPDLPAAALSLVTEEDRPRVDSPASPVLVRTRGGMPAGVGELGEVWMRAADGTLRPMGGAGRYRPDGSVELAVAAPAPSAPVATTPPLSARNERGAGPRPETERAVAAIWAEVLGIPAGEIAPDVDFFALGGHSLRATQVLSRMRARLGVRLPIRAFFAAPTVAALASAVDAQAPSAAPSASPEPAPAAPESAESPLSHSRTLALSHFPPGVYPLSFAQQRLWVLAQLGGTAAYHLASALRMTGPLDEWALERALDEVVRRHEALRTRIEEREGEPVQVIQPARPVRLRAEDVRPADGESVDDALRGMAEEEAARPFPAAGPFLRVRLLRAADDDHVLLWTLHHLVADGWSLGIFQDELLALYRAFATESEPDLPPLAIQYGEHALVQRRELSGGALDELVAWWRERLAGSPALLELPTDRPRPAQPSGAGASLWFGFPDGTAKRVVRAARDTGATPFMVLLAAFQALLSRWSGQDDVVVGTPIANRTRPELERVIGLFANTLALRGDLSGEPTFAGLLARVREATLGAYEHQDLPFERLVEELNPERSLAHSPVFQVMFALQNAPKAGGGAELAGLTLSALPRTRETAQFDLSLALHQDGDALAARLEYATDLFGAATMERFAKQFVRLLDAALDDPSRPVSGLPLLSDPERVRLLADSAGPSAGYPDVPLHAPFESQADRTPDAVALVSGGEGMTYAQLDARANQLSHLLRARGIGREQTVAVLMERSMEMVVALYGILKAGAAYVPVDPEYPADRVSYMLRDSAAALVLTQERGMDAVSSDADAIALDRPGVLDGFPANRPVPDASGTDRLAYVIYTSGSTGRPKGAMNAHRGVVNRILWMQDAFGLAPDDAVLQKTPFSFDVSVWELFWPLAVGARLVMAPPGAHRDPAALTELIEREHITTLHFVPSMLRAWLDAADAARCTSLRRVMSSGEALSADLVERFMDALPSAGLHNLYGPTEAAVDVTHWPCTRPEHGVVPIGAPIANTRMYVLDPTGAPCPAGVPGELWIGGVQVGRGYWRRPAMTAERFVPDPFAPAAGSRMYRTGDRARWREIPERSTEPATADNSRTPALTHSRTAVLEYLGRTDFQVKVRGFRIEPGEIEAALKRHPSVSDAVVVALGKGDEARLVAYLTARGGSFVPADPELRAHLSRGLPDYMVPSAFVAMDAIPLTPSGKVDRRALPAPDFAARAEGWVAPRTPAEEIVAGIWAELLGIGRVGARDDFFRLGGHSLLGTRVLSRIRERLGVEVPLTALFEAPRLDGFAARVDAAVRAGAGVRVPPIARTEGDTAPLSFAQERMWFLDRLEPGPAYNLSPALRLHGPLEVDAMERALAEIVRRHEPLRSTFPEADGAPVQRIHPADGFQLPVEALAGDADLGRRVGEWAARPFDLRRGPVFRALLLRLAQDDHVLLLGMHHIVTDGWSIGILFRELFALYDAFAQARPSPLPPLPVRYADYAAWQRTWLAENELERQVGYWRERLAGAPALLELPADYPRPAVQSYRGAAHPFVIPPETADGVRALARREGATLFMALLSAWSVLLSRWSGQDDVVVGTPIAGRTRRETEELVGLFVNTLALRTELRGDPPFRALLEQVRRRTLEAYAHQDLPFEKLVEEIRPARSLSHAPVFQAMFVLQNTPEGPDAAPSGLTLAAVAREGSQARVDLALTVVEDADGSLSASLGYAADLFAPETIERLASQFQTLVGGIVARPETPVAALPLVDDAERARLLAALAGPAIAQPDAPVHVLIARQASRAPDATAVVGREGALTYAQLHARAGRIARRLVVAGVRPGDAVAVLAEPSPDAVAALLGVMMSGGAFLPLDPGSPADRLAFALDDARAAAVLAQPHLAGRLPATALPVLSLAAAEDASAPDAPLPDVHPASLAWILYTSGSTGRPKAVGVPHAAAALHLASAARRYALAPGERMLAFMALTFDPWLEQVLAPLCAGASVALRDLEVWTPAELAAAVRGMGITIVAPPTAYWHHLVDDAPSAESIKRTARLVTAGGEAMRPDAAACWAALPGDATLVNVYGPTEAVVVALAWDVDDTDSATAARLPIGRPLAGRAAYVLDARGEPVPPGVPGELYLGGAALARGYLYRPALTAVAFVPDPFAPAAGSRMYRTGDHVRIRHDGSIEYLGRADQQVKVRGFRIEPGEIEAALKRHPSIAAAVVVARAEDREARLVAYLTASAGSSVPLDAELRGMLSRELPEYMVPSAFVALDAIPLTSSGKVDRRALPDPGASIAGGYVVPRDRTELEVARIWGEALGIPRVGAMDDFFRLGGHSLLALRMMARVRERFGRELPLAALFRHPTVAAFAQALRREGAGADDDRLLVPLNAEGTLPPLFFFPPAGGTVTHYADLARRMGPDQPFYALQAPGISGAEAPLESVEALAARYLEEIRAAQPRGPYWLGGWSAGGAPAFEAARQLRAAGEEVALLAIVDAAPPDGLDAGAPPDNARLLRLFAGDMVLQDEALLDQLEADLRAMPRDEHLPAFARWIALHGEAGMDAEVERIARTVDVFAATVSALRAYRDPPPFVGPVALFVASEGKRDEATGRRLLPDRWRPFVRGELTVHIVPGQHEHLVLDPAAEVLARQLREVMARVRESEAAVR